MRIDAVRVHDRHMDIGVTTLFADIANPGFCSISIKVRNHEHNARDARRCPQPLDDQRHHTRATAGTGNEVPCRRRYVRDHAFEARTRS